MAFSFTVCISVNIDSALPRCKMSWARCSKRRYTCSCKKMCSVNLKLHKELTGWFDESCTHDLDQWFSSRGLLVAQSAHNCNPYDILRAIWAVYILCGCGPQHRAIYVAHNCQQVENHWSRWFLRITTGTLMIIQRLHLHCDLGVWFPAHVHELALAQW